MLVSIFRGKFAFVLKVIALLLLSSILVMLAQQALASGEYAIAIFLGLATFAINFIYLTKTSIPLKFFLPGLLFLLAFVVGPVLYTLSMSGFVYQTGNTLSKEDAIVQIEKLGKVQDENGTIFDVGVGKTNSNELGIIYFDSLTNEFAISTAKARTVEPASTIVKDDFDLPASSPNFRPLTDEEFSAVDAQISELRFFYNDEFYLGLEGFQAASLYKPSLQFDKANDEFRSLVNVATTKALVTSKSGDTLSSIAKANGTTVSALLAANPKLTTDPKYDNGSTIFSGTKISLPTSIPTPGDIYRDNGRGNFANVNDAEDKLQPGWRAPIWFENYTKLFTDERLRTPFIEVFLWTISFAALSVLTTFALGLLLALALNKAIRGRRVYRSILILPYAMPSVMSILIWGGMFDTEFGAINNLFGTDVAWFQNAAFARTAVIVVNLWLGFPYFYLVASGALQAIPAELSEAAAIDGASPRQIFNKITLPLLLKILSPLLIASFAFNFNNFNLIYLLTGGGPIAQLDGEIAGATDILISYTYKIAFNEGNSNLGLASAISVLIFLLVASISLYGLKKSKVLEDFV